MLVGDSGNKRILESEGLVARLKIPDTRWDIVNIIVSKVKRQSKCFIHRECLSNHFVS